MLSWTKSRIMTHWGPSSEARVIKEQAGKEEKRMTEKFCQDWGQGPHKLKLGKSFEPKKGSGAPVYNRWFSKSHPISMHNYSVLSPQHPLWLQAHINWSRGPWHLGGNSPQFNLKLMTCRFNIAVAIITYDLHVVVGERWAKCCSQPSSQWWRRPNHL